MPILKRMRTHGGKKAHLLGWGSHPFLCLVLHPDCWNLVVSDASNCGADAASGSSSGAKNPHCQSIVGKYLSSHG